MMLVLSDGDEIRQYKNKFLKDVANKLHCTLKLFGLEGKILSCSDLNISVYKPKIVRNKNKRNKMKSK